LFEADLFRPVNKKMKQKIIASDWRLEKARARPVLDRRRLEETSNAPFAHDSDTPGPRSAVQNKASTHQLALPAIISCPIALIARISNMVKCHSGLQRHMEQSTRTGCSKRQELAPC